MIQAARYLRVGPWEVADRPVYWLLAAEAASQVDAILEQQASEQANRKGRG